MNIIWLVLTSHFDGLVGRLAELFDEVVPDQIQIIFSGIEPVARGLGRTTLRSLADTFWVRARWCRVGTSTREHLRASAGPVVLALE